MFVFGKKYGFLVMAATNTRYLVPKLCKTRFSESTTLKIGYGALQLTTHAPKICFGPKKWLFFGKKSGFLVMVAPEPVIICSKTLQNALS